MRDIVIGKLVDRTIDDDYEELSERLFGEGNCFSASEVRKRMYGMKAIIEAIERDGEESIRDADTLSALDVKKIELQMERQKFYDQRNAFNRLIRERSRQEELNEILVEAVKSGNLPQLHYERFDIAPSDNDLLVSLNDIHYGANVSNFWNTYNSDVCREMMCRYLDRIISIGETHRSENCVVWANGDEISGNIHQSIAVTNKENVIEQIKGISVHVFKILRTSQSVVARRLTTQFIWLMYVARPTVVCMVTLMEVLLRFRLYKQWQENQSMPFFLDIFITTKLMRCKV